MFLAPGKGVFSLKEYQHWHPRKGGFILSGDSFFKKKKKKKDDLFIYFCGRSMKDVGS